jgi:exopolyphosphatase/guanosine-5'-triphosphate,3'-diphosphate pyrophosphatase
MMVTEQRAALAPETEKQLRVLTTHEDEAVRRRALIILRTHEGITAATVAEEAGVSVSGVRHWLKQFRERGIESLGGGIPQLPVERPSTDSEPAKSKRGRKPKAPQEDDGVVDTPAEAVLPIVMAETPVPPTKAKQGKRGRPEKETPPPVVESVAPVTPAEASGQSKRGRKPKQPEPVIETPAIPEPHPAPQITTITGLVNYYGVDLAHARHVTAQAYRLFDSTTEIHRLPDSTRRLLEAGALLHGIADQIDADNHHLKARDIILETPLERFSLHERAQIALLAAFHRKKVHPERELIYAELPPVLQKETLALAAILRIADGLDAYLTQTTQISDVQVNNDEILIWVTGERAAEDSIRARNKADLWEHIFGQPVIIERLSDQPRTQPAVPILTAPPSMRTDPVPDLVLSLDPAMGAGHALRRLTLHYADRLDRLMGMVRGGEERRLPALQRELDRLRGLFPLVLPPTAQERFINDFKALNSVVEMALFAQSVYERALPLADDPDEPAASSIALRMDSWKTAVQNRIGTINTQQYDQLMGDLRRELLSEPPVDAQTIGAIVGSIVWERLGQLRDRVERGESVSDGLEAARELQDSILYFRSLMGSEAVQALDMLTPFEGYLSAIHLVQGVLGVLGVDTAAAAIRGHQEQLLNELADGLPTVWGTVNSPVFRRAVALAVAVA